MKYVIMGSGGTGASIGGFLANAKHDVTLIARGNHLNAICQHGLILHSDKLGEIILKNIKAMTTDEYISSGEKADVIFVAVKGYSINEIIPFLQKASDTHTIIIPILNIYGTGRYLAEKLPQTNVLEGCIYIVAYISAPGEITQSGDIFRIVYGTRGPSPLKAQLLQIKQDLENSGIKVVLSENIADDTFRKFTFVSPFAAAAAYYDINAGAIQQKGKEQDLFIALTKDCMAIAEAYNIKLPDDIMDINLKIMYAVTPDTTASMQKDLARGHQSEMDGLIFEIVRMARQKNITVPAYEKVASHFGFKIN